MKPARLEAFSDGVLAIIITIMVIEIHAPESLDPVLLLELWPKFVSYVLSFLVIAIYWINHHHLVHHLAKITTPILWANTFLLFWLSLLPFATAYMGTNVFGGYSVTLYSFTAFMCALAYYFLDTAIRSDNTVDKHGGHGHRDSSTFSKFLKNHVALVIYGLALIFSRSLPWLSLMLVCIPAVMYFMPRLEE